jgi:hypothetical protein
MWVCVTKIRHAAHSDENAPKHQQTTRDRADVRQSYKDIHAKGWAARMSKHEARIFGNLAATVKSKYAKQ